MNLSGKVRTIKSKKNVTLEPLPNITAKETSLLDSVINDAK